jgi:multisubunit Na+/H+ antiporter MnhB subunit
LNSADGKAISANLEFMRTPSPSFDRRSIAATLLFIEGGVVLALGVWLVILGFTHENREILPLLGVVLFCILGGLGLIQCGRGYREGKNYGKAPAVLANLIALGIVKYQMEASAYYLAIPIGILAVATLLMVLTIASRENKTS